MLYTDMTADRGSAREGGDRPLGTISGEVRGGDGFEMRTGETTGAMGEERRFAGAGIVTGVDRVGAGRGGGLRVGGDGTSSKLTRDKTASTAARAEDRAARDSNSSRVGIRGGLATEVIVTGVSPLD